MGNKDIVIYTRLQESLGDNTKRLQECIDMLHILSVNRNLAGR
uniref:Uncharacterized protein n=1 Tax=Candidatus Kentrum sp. TUN TaxID=2126343 RepID=A0A451A9I6_9GAMM|nr:MAG: hypothetical protein BECKTUN1418D_GA0071000_11833 [Candidatus Kentron sp. TUN]